MPQLTDLRRALATLALGLFWLSPPTARADAAEPLPSLRGADGRLIRLVAPEKGATVVVFYSSECPISNAYSPTLNELAAAFPRVSVRFVGACVDPDLTDADLRAHAKDFELKFPVASDRQGVLSRALGAKVTPEAFLIDDRGRVRYRGRIDDQFAARRLRNANPMTHELRDALADLVEGRDVKVESTEPVGCPIPEYTKGKEAPTYAHDVAAILQRSCQECHRRGQVGPFPLETYEQARKRADDLARVVDDRAMPPWKPAPHVGAAFKYDRSLTTDEIATITAWAEAGAPQGNPKDQPPAPSFPDEWALGTPDLVVEPASEYAIPAEGADIYRCFVIPTNLPDDVYLSAIEYRPGNRKVVHHMLAYVDTSGKARERDKADPGEGYTCFSGPGIEIHGDLGGWAPGNEPSRLPDGVGRALPKGADVVLQVHYHPNGKPESDRSRIGLYFSRTPVKQTLHWNAAINFEFKLRPGESHQKVEAAWPVPVDVEALAISPHMHLLGRDMLITVTFPDGRTRDLVRIDDWDFSWQNTYYFEKPLDLPKGSVIKVVAHFDNSADNPRNPNHPPKLVKFGEATTDEMCIGFIAVTKKGQNLTRPGEKDDLREIFKRQIDEYRRRAEQRGRMSD